MLGVIVVGFIFTGLSGTKPHVWVAITRMMEAFFIISLSSLLVSLSRQSHFSDIVIGVQVYVVEEIFADLNLCLLPFFAVTCHVKKKVQVRSNRKTYEIRWQRM